MIEKIKEEIKRCERQIDFYQARLDKLEGVTGRSGGAVFCTANGINYDDGRILATRSEINASKKALKNLKFTLELAEKLECQQK